jgi:MFS family permease
MFGSRISVVAFPMLVLRLDGPLAAGLVTCATIFPRLLAYIPAGVLVDRWKPLRVLLVSEIGRGIATGAIAVMLLFSLRPSVFLLIPAMIIEQLLEAFATLAEGRCASSIVARDDVPRAQAYLQARVHIAILVGRPVGLFLFVLNPILPFLADALSFACSAASLIAVQKTCEALRGPPGRMPVARWLDELRDGFRELECDKHAARTMLLVAGATLIAQALLMVFLAEAQAHQLSATAMALVLGASGVGGVLGSAVAGRVPRLAQRNWLPVQMCALSAALAVLAGIGGRSPVAAIAVMAIFGFTGAIGNVTFMSYLVQTFPSRMLARVTSIGQVLTIGALGLGPVLGGTAADRYDGRKAITVLLTVAIFLLLVSVRSHVYRLVISQRTRLAFWWSGGRREHDINPGWPASERDVSSRVVRDRPGSVRVGHPASVVYSSRAGPIAPVLAQGLPPGLLLALAVPNKPAPREGFSHCSQIPATRFRSSQYPDHGRGRHGPRSLPAHETRERGAAINKADRKPSCPGEVPQAPRGPNRTAFAR